MTNTRNLYTAQLEQMNGYHDTSGRTTKKSKRSCYRRVFPLVNAGRASPQMYRFFLFHITSALSAVGGAATAHGARYAGVGLPRSQFSDTYFRRILGDRADVGIHFRSSILNDSASDLRFVLRGRLFSFWAHIFG